MQNAGVDQYSIYKVGVTGTGLTQVIAWSGPNGPDQKDPTLSPDGRTLAFVSSVAPDGSTLPAREAAALIDAVDSPWVGSYWDMANAMWLGFDDVEQGYEATPGKVTIATMHAAKGLEWDRVYLMAVSNYGFPSAQRAEIAAAIL